MEDAKLVESAVETLKADVLALDNAVNGAGTGDGNPEGAVYQDGEFKPEAVDPVEQRNGEEAAKES